jgi:hypothetical protein
MSRTELSIALTREGDNAVANRAAFVWYVVVINFLSAANCRKSKCEEDGRGVHVVWQMVRWLVVVTGDGWRLENLIVSKMWCPNQEFHFIFIPSTCQHTSQAPSLTLTSFLACPPLHHALGEISEPPSDHYIVLSPASTTTTRNKPQLTHSGLCGSLRQATGCFKNCSHSSICRIGIGRPGTSRH